MEKKKSKVKGFIKTLVFIGLVGTLIGVLFYNQIKIDKMPDSEEVNINLDVKNCLHCALRVYNTENEQTIPQNDYVLLYEGFTADTFINKDNEEEITYSEQSYIVKLQWNLTYENDDVEMLKQEEAYLKEKLGSHFSNNIAELDKENYWVAARYDFSQENPNATYDIAFNTTDFNLNDKNLQEVIRYFDLEFAYDKKYNAFTDLAWDKRAYFYNPPFKNLLNNYLEIGLC